MMRFIYTSVFLLCMNALHSQSTSEIFRLADYSYGTAGKLYNVDILILESDGSYEEIKKKFLSKRMAKKNISLSTSVESGSWRKEGDTLYLVENNRQRAMKYFFVNHNNLSAVIEDLDIISKAKLKRIK